MVCAVGGGEASPLVGHDGLADAHDKDPSAAWDKLDLDAQLRTQCVRHPGGAWEVVSNHAVFDANHLGLLDLTQSLLAARPRSTTGEEIQAEIHLELPVVRLHVLAESVKGAVVVLVTEMGQLVNDHHA